MYTQRRAHIRSRALTHSHGLGRKPRTHRSLNAAHSSPDYVSLYTVHRMWCMFLCFCFCYFLCRYFIVALHFSRRAQSLRFTWIHLKPISRSQTRSQCERTRINSNWIYITHIYRRHIQEGIFTSRRKPIFFLLAVSRCGVRRQNILMITRLV